MGAFWNPQSEQMRWFMEKQGYLAMRVMHDWLFVKKDSEYAEGALEIIRDVRQRLAKNEKPPGAIEKFLNPFND